MPVLTGELGGTGIVRTIGDVAAHLLSGLLQVPPPSSSPVPGIAQPSSVIVRWGAIGVVQPSVWWDAVWGGWWLWSESW